MVARKAAAAKSPKAGGGTATIIIIVGTVTAVTALPVCILFAAGMLPTVAAAIVDRHRRHYLARSVGAMNLAGMVPAVQQLWSIGISLAGVQHVLSNSLVWLVMYGAAAFGWLVYLAMPLVARVIIDLRTDQVKRQLEDRAKALTEQWGEEVSGRGPEKG